MLGDFQLVPTIEEFEGILGCPLGESKPYLFFGCYPSTTRIAKVVKISAQELDRVKQKKKRGDRNTKEVHGGEGGSSGKPRRVGIIH